MATTGEDVYATLLLSDSYLPGALVLAHSLKDAGTTKKLAVLVTASLSADAMTELKKLYDYIIPVERIANPTPANLFLMNRGDLHSTFTKIVLWKQTQFRRIVYIDADIVALRAPDELFHLPSPFSAAPDIGWPDLFNSGLMVLSPNMGDYYALLAMAQRGISFDGADQGLLNMHFKNSWNRLSFTYNVTPSGHYQYVPAYKHFQSMISMVHFIGTEKPWTEGREAHQGSGPYDELVGRWWAVYDRHYREHSAAISGQGVSQIVQRWVKGEYQPSSFGYSSSQPAFKGYPYASSNVESANVPPIQTHTEQKQQEFHAPMNTWDPTRAPPPSNSAPEAHNFPSTQYTMSNDTTPFRAPARYPDPPKNMYYEVPKKAPAYKKLAPIFPWERRESKPSRVFPEDLPSQSSSNNASGTAPNDEKNREPLTPTTPTIRLTPADPWGTYARGNAWDDIPEIERYIGALQKSRKGNIQVLSSGINSPVGSHTRRNSEKGSGEVGEGSGGRRPSLKLTDFPTELERPSLPVTPAPIRRPTFWGEERDEKEGLPAAEGVPSQADWDPAAQLEALARHQSEVLASKLGSPTPDLPMRPLPYGSEGVKSSTYVMQTPKYSRAATPFGFRNDEGIDDDDDYETPTGKDLGKALSAASTETPAGYSGKAPMARAGNTKREIEEPSYHGPSAQWEKDEDGARVGTQALTEGRGLGASEEERDVLDN